MTVLRGNKREGYRSTDALECPHCTRGFDVRGVAAEDRQGPHLVLYAVAPRPGEYDAATLRHVRNGPPSEHTGVALPRPPENVPFSDDPVPTFSREDT